MLWLIVPTILAFSFWILYIKPLKFWTNQGVKQAKPWPILGDLWGVVFRTTTFSELISSWFDKYPNERYIGFYQFQTPTLMIKDLELIKQITVRDFDHFTDHRTFVISDIDPLFNRNLPSLKGQEWREMRATLSGSYTSSKMKIIFGLMIETATNFVDYFLDKKEDFIESEMRDVLTKFTNDVIATTAFGIEVNSLKEPENKFYLMGKIVTASFLSTFKFFAFFIGPKFCKLFNIHFTDRKAANYFQNIINETIKTREEKGIKRPDMINVLLETRKGINQEEIEIVDSGFATAKEFDSGSFKPIKNVGNEEIAAQAFAFFLGGFDTVSIAMGFAAYELALNKDIQNKLRQELMNTDKKVDGKLTYEALLDMKYLDMVVSEILRKWAPFPSTDRICTKPYTIEPVNPGESPIHLEKGQTIILPIYAIQRHSNFYPDPEKFDPERFSSENKGKIKPYTYFPFGVGPRSCIASRFALLEIKILLYKLLLHFEVVPCEKTAIPLKLCRKSFMNKPENGLWLGLKRIQS